MKLHYTMVRRARGLSMPLPPTPKRPIGPPVLFGFRDIPIRRRADAIEAWGSWEGFLDDIAFTIVSDPEWLPHSVLGLIERMVPPAELQAHREAMKARIEKERHDRAAADEAFHAEVAEKGVGGIILDRLFRRAA